MYYVTVEFEKVSKQLNYSFDGGAIGMASLVIDKTFLRYPDALSVTVEDTETGEKPLTRTQDQDKEYKEFWINARERVKKEAEENNVPFP